MLSANTWTSSQPVSAWQLWDPPREPVLPILPTETEAARGSVDSVGGFWGRGAVGRQPKQSSGSGTLR